MSTRSTRRGKIEKAALDVLALGESWRLRESRYPDRETSQMCLLVERKGTDGIWEPKHVFPSAVSARYTSAVAQALTNGVPTIIDFATKDHDTDSAITTGAAWKFTCPAGKGGLYSVLGAVSVVNGGAVAGEAAISVYRNGAEVSTGARHAVAGGATVWLPFPDALVLAPTDYLDVRVYHNLGVGAATLEAAASRNHVSITRVPGDSP